MTYGVNSPLGLVPSSYLGSAPWSGGFIQIPITANYSTGLFTGDLCAYSSGLLVRATAGNTSGQCGVFNGCYYVQTNGQPVFSPYWPASQAIMSGTTAMANVIVDPNTEFNIQASGTVTQANIGKNADVTFATAGNTATGLSGMMLDISTIATTNTLPLHIVNFTNVPGNVAGVSYVNLLVKLNNSVFSAGATGV